MHRLRDCSRPITPHGSSRRWPPNSRTSRVAPTTARRRRSRPSANCSTTHGAARDDPRCRSPDAGARCRLHRVRAQPRRDARRASGRTPPSARQGAQVHGPRPRAGDSAGTPRSRARRRERSSAWRAPASATTCCSRTRSSTRDRLRALAASGARVTVAVDSRGDDRRRGRAADRARCLIDVNVGMPRCGCPPERAAAIADRARSRGPRRARRHGLRGSRRRARRPRPSARRRPRRRWQLLARAHEAVGGDVVSAGGTGTYDLKRGDRDPSRLVRAHGHRLRRARARRSAPALHDRRHGRSPSSRSVGRRRLRPEGARHGPRQPDDRRRARCGSAPTSTSRSRPSATGRRVGDRVLVWPAHVDPTVAYHDVDARRRRSRCSTQPSSTTGPSTYAAGPSDGRDVGARAINMGDASRHVCRYSARCVSGSPPPRAKPSPGAHRTGASLARHESRAGVSVHFWPRFFIPPLPRRPAHGLGPAGSVAAHDRPRRARCHCTSRTRTQRRCVADRAGRRRDRAHREVQPRAERGIHPLFDRARAKAAGGAARRAVHRCADRREGSRRQPGGRAVCTTATSC